MTTEELPDPFTLTIDGFKKLDSETQEAVRRIGFDRLLPLARDTFDKYPECSWLVCCGRPPEVHYRGAGVDPAEIGAITGEALGSLWWAFRRSGDGLSDIQPLETILEDQLLDKLAEEAESDAATLYDVYAAESSDARQGAKAMMDRG